MRDERRGVSKDQMIQSAKENAEMVEFIKSLTKEEMKRIKDSREYDTIKVGTPTYKIAVLCDQLRQNARKITLNITKRIWNIDQLENNICRLKTQKISGKITETMKDGIIMNENELNSLIKHHEWLKDGEFYSLYPSIAELRSIVGHKDIAKNIIMTIEEFDNYVLSIEKELKKYNYNLFGELK